MNGEVLRTHPRICFFEVDPSAPLLRRGLVEGVGTLLLMFIVTSSAALSQRGEAAILAPALAGAATLVALVVALGAVSGGHFNPLITLLQWLGRERNTRCTVVYIAAQMFGSVLGACAAGRVIGLVPRMSAPPDSNWWMPGEFIATTGLLVIVFGSSRGGHADTGPFAVGTWLLAAAIAVPSAYVNPALTIGAVVAKGPVSLDGRPALQHVLAQLLGALLAFAIIRASLPKAEFLSGIYPVRILSARTTARSRCSQARRIV